jgi:hypothetical protein
MIRFIGGRLSVRHVFRFHIPLAKILEAPLLLPLLQLFMIIAVFAWVLTFAGLIDSRLNRVSRAQSSG